MHPESFENRCVWEQNYVPKVDGAISWTLWISCVHFLFRSLGPENLLLKGATLKNTKKIYGEHFFKIYLLEIDLLKPKCS